MKPRERVFAALEHKISDRVPRFEIWIDALIEELGQGDAQDVYVNTGQDCIMMPTAFPKESNAWGDGIDEWGRVWRKGLYAGGVVESEDDLERYSPPLTYVNHFFNSDEINRVKRAYPDHCSIFGTHVGPFTAAYMAMGFERFFLRLSDDIPFILKLLEARTEWCIALYQKAIETGAEALVLGDDAAHRGGPMISPQMWRELVLPFHREIVERLDVPVIWHSDGNIAPLLPMAVEAGFVGVHGLEPAAGLDLGKIKRDFGHDLVLIGNIDVNVLLGADLEAVRDEVSRCMKQGASGGGYMMATCNSIFEGMNPAAVTEMFKCEQELGA